MAEKQEDMSPDASIVKNVILTNRKHFGTYNITRLRELLRYLPTKKLDLFYTIPLLLHVNSPDYPGYVDNPQIPHGIYGFFDSGFWRLAKRRLNIEMKDVRPFISKSFCIKGIYLIGSAGSLGQSEKTDFDYWVVVDKNGITDMQRGLLKKKLRIIETWAKKAYDQHLTFFLLDSEQVRQNDFSGFDEEGIRTAQRTLLKEEFYRTFILIGGQVPYWALLPVGLADSQYSAWVKRAEACGGRDFFPDDYIDLGNLTCINKEECYGALLWQFCKAQDDPVMALIKASLMVQHLLSQQDQGLLCDITKKRIPESRMDSCFLDPYALAFDKVLRFYEKQGDQEGLDFMRQCIYLRIVGFPVPSELEIESPKNQILQRYLRDWSWEKTETDRLQEFSFWRENEKLAFEKKVIGKLWDLYRLAFRTVEEPAFRTGMANQDVVALKNKASSHFKKKEGKIPFASVYLRSLKKGSCLLVVYQQRTDKNDSWTIFDGSANMSSNKEDALYAAPELLKIMGWVAFNGLLKGTHATIDLPQAGSPIPPGRLKRLLSELIDFFSHDVSPQSYRKDKPQWERVFVAMDTSRFFGERQQHCADFLIQNSWGEIFFHSLNLGHTNRLLKHHEIAKGVWKYLQNADLNRSTYRFFDLRTIEDPTTGDAIEGFLSDLQKGGERPTAMPRELAHNGGEKRGLLLDLF